MKEIALTPFYNDDDVIETVYFGGGTPSLLPAAQIEAVLDVLQRKFTISNTAEITLEANPDDISALQLTTWRKMGINRLSIGVQSFFEEDLSWMNRAHNAEQSVNSIHQAQEAGFDDLTIDLIYGSPGLSDKKWEQNIRKAIDLRIPHLSCYALTVEPKTALHNMIIKKKMPDTDTEQQARQFMQLTQWLQEAGYEHYEISNFSIPGRRSRHNTSYWQGKPYYGFGPSAHSFNGTDTRSWNIANNALYIQSLAQNTVPAEKEKLTVTQRLNEYIMTSLRTMEGADLGYIRKNFGDNVAEGVISSAQRYINSGKLMLNNQKLVLTDTGKLFADGIAADLFESEE